MRDRARGILMLASTAVCAVAVAASGAGAGHGTSCPRGAHACPPGSHGGSRACARGGGYDPAADRRRAAVDHELHERTEKTRRAQEAFAKTNPCPATGASGLACPGFIVECAEPDPATPDRCYDPENLRWRRSRSGTPEPPGAEVRTAS